MPKINVLPKNVAELIAAGEVVERPASVIKELIENAIDAGADHITAEINHGGVSLMRITDNGCGMTYDDLPLAFLRHATSKISVGEDLDAIGTLGFRGEALAAVSSVARVEVFSKTADSELGTHYCIEGGEETLHEEAGCPDGTTIIVRDLFYNTPARMKFLKKDVSEANAVAAVADRIALSHPEVSLKLIRDGKQVLMTPGDGKLQSVVYNVLGREFFGSLIPVDFERERVKVTGLTCKPVACRQTRNSQFCFLNGRLVRSTTVMAAAEQAYKNSAMSGKFPGFILYINCPLDWVDVNVHPAKTEVRFADERRIFDAVYAAVKNAITAGDTRPSVLIKQPAANPFAHISAEEYRQQAIKTEEPALPKVAVKTVTEQSNLHSTDFAPVRLHDTVDIISEGIKLPEIPKEKVNIDIAVEEEPDLPAEVPAEEPPETVEEVRLIGEAFKTYVIAEMGQSVYFIDKHAAHERILFNKLKAEIKIEVQPLLTPLSITLSKEDYDAIISNTDLLSRSGFDIEDFGKGTVILRAVPVPLTDTDLSLLVTELAAGLLKGGKISIEKLENIYHTVSCRAAIKAGNNNSSLELSELAKTVLNSKDIMYCPHGRPVAFELKKHDFEKQFGRIQ